MPLHTYFQNKLQLSRWANGKHQILLFCRKTLKTGKYGNLAKMHPHCNTESLCWLVSLDYILLPPLSYYTFYKSCSWDWGTIWHMIMNQKEEISRNTPSLGQTEDRFESKALLIELLRWYVLLSTCSEAILWASWSQSNCAAASAVLCPLEELLRTAQQEVSGTNLLKSSLPASLLRQSSAHETC